MITLPFTKDDAELQADVLAEIARDPRFRPAEIGVEVDSGVVTLTGVGFKISYIITSAAQTIAGGLGTLVPSAIATSQSLTLFAALTMTALVCVLMGCGIPTTAPRSRRTARALRSLDRARTGPLDSSCLSADR